MSSTPARTITPYIPAVLRKNSHGYVIEYYFLNHLSGGYVRRTIKLNRIRKRFGSVKDFKEYATSIICKLNVKLAGGWSPIGEVVNTRVYVPIAQVIDQYIREKQSSLAKNTMMAYRSFSIRLKSWVEKNYPQCNCALFTKVIAIQFMDHIWAGDSAVVNKSKKRAQCSGHVSERTYNNNLKLGRAFFAWCIDKCYAKENPFETIKPKREAKKKRTLIPKQIRTKIDQYFAENNPAMRIVCRLVYTSLLRPIEVSRVRVHQILYDKSCIYMPFDQTKNGKERYGRIDDDLARMLQEYLRGAAATDYIFSDGTWSYGSKQKNSHAFGNAWEKMREDLDLPEEYQLYSLRDTGIHDLLIDGVVDLDVMHAAGHSDLTMTTRYADHIDEGMISRINNQASGY